MIIGDTRKIGKKKYIIAGQGDDVFEAITDLKKASFYDVHKCGICQSDNLTLDAHVAGVKKFKYATVKCLDCKAQLNFGKTQDGNNTMYLRMKDNKLDWQAYTPKTDA